MKETGSSISTFYLGLYEWLQSLAFAIMGVVFIFVFIGSTMNVEQTSMTPTLLDGDRIIISNLFYTPKAGDIVVFSKYSFEEGAPLVKRVVATEGQVVDIDTAAGTVSVDGALLEEDYTLEPTYTVYDVEFPATVPEGHIFVMGDNRNGSKDSRDSAIGMVDTREVLGRVYAVVLPFSRLQLVLN